MTIVCITNIRHEFFKKMKYKHVKNVKINFKSNLKFVPYMSALLFIVVVFVFICEIVLKILFLQFTDVLLT